jgi:oxygen-independent coproporphyrinogen-3 oxidase
MRLYIHWPFCVSRCSYCDFNSRVAGSSVIQVYRRALLEEIGIWSMITSKEGRHLESIYLGGGTPSTMSGDEASDLLRKVSCYFNLRPGAEVTIEVNPASWTYDDFASARDGGFNRFSIGVQSLEDDMLRFLERAHDSNDAREAMRSVLSLGDAAISVDILFALPLFGSVSFTETLDEVLEWQPHHISAYALTGENNVRLPALLSAAGLSLPEEDEAADQYLEVYERLKAGGYEQYEISNFCLPGYHSRHNLAYWRREEYLGMGAGAHSFFNRYRFSNQRSVLCYMKSIKSGHLAVERCDYVNPAEELEEKVMLGLRTSHGIPEELLEGCHEIIGNMEGLDLLGRVRGRVRLTPRGMFVSNAVISELLLSLETPTDMTRSYA